MTCRDCARCAPWPERVRFACREAKGGKLPKRVLDGVCLAKGYVPVPVWMGSTPEERGCGMFEAGSRESWLRGIKTEG